MNVFEKSLQESYMALEEASNPMSSDQSTKVDKMKSHGWSVDKKEDSKVVMSKGDKEVFVYDSGKTFFVSEGEEIDVTDIAETLFEGDSE